MENGVRQYVLKNIRKTEEELKIAELLVKKELRGKMIMSQVRIDLIFARVHSILLVD